MQHVIIDGKKIPVIKCPALPAFGYTSNDLVKDAYQLSLTSGSNKPMRWGKI